VLLCCVGCVKDTGVLVLWRLSGAIREDNFFPFNRLEINTLSVP